MQERKLVRSWWLFLVPYVVLVACILRILMHPRYIYLSTCSVKCPLKKEKGSKEGTKGRGLQTNRKQSIMYAHRYVYYICRYMST